jgi:uncharacterized membrane protein
MTAVTGSRRRRRAPKERKPLTQTQMGIVLALGIVGAFVGTIVGLIVLTIIIGFATGY